MQSSYVQLPPQQKVKFCNWMFEIGNENFRAVASLLCEEPYSTAFICQTATARNFLEYGVDGNFYTQFSDAADNATLYELDQMSSAYYFIIRDFIGFLSKQDDSTVMYKAGMKLVELCRMTKSMKDIEQEAVEALQAKANESVSIGYASIENNMIVQEGPAQKQDGVEQVAFNFIEFQ